MKTASEIRAEGMAALVAALGAVQAERLLRRFRANGLITPSGDAGTYRK